MLALSIIVAVVLAWFSPWWIGGRVLAPLDLQNRMMSPWRGANETEFAKNHIVSDAVDQYLVYRLIAERDYRKEGWVGWSSLTYGGTAQYANTMALYYDWTMQLHRWFDFWKAWHLGLMGQLMLAGVGMHLFLKGRGINGLWSVCGALLYAANSQFVTWIYHRWALGGFCWVPWILWAIDGYRHGNKRFWAAVPVFTAMAFLGGTLQHAALVALTVAASWMEEAFLQHSKSKIQNPTFKFTTQWPLLGRYLIWGLLGSGLAAMMLVPCVDAFVTSNRLGLHTGMTANAGNSIYPQGPLQPLFNLAAYPFQIFPSILGRCGSVDVLKLFKSELFYVVYFGSLPVWVAYLAFWKKSSPVLARMLIGAGLILPLTPLVRILYQRLFLLFILGGILAFVHFMQNSAKEERLKLFRFVSIIAGLGVACWTALSGLFGAKADILGKIRDQIASDGQGSSFGFFRVWIAERADRFVGDLLVWSPQQLFPLMFLAAAVLGLRWTASNHIRLRRSGALLVVLAVTGEVMLFGSRWIVWSNPSRHPLFAETQETLALHNHVGRNGRVTTVIHPTAHMAMTPFIPNTLAAYQIVTVTGYDSIIPDGMVLPNESPGDAEKLGRFAVSHLITWHGNPNIPTDWNPIWKSSTMDLYVNPVKVPRYSGFHSIQDKNAFLAGAWTDPIEIPESLGKENDRLLDVPAGVEWIRIAENHADGWEYRLQTAGAEWMPAARAVDASMLLENPRPDRNGRIEMRYNPPMRKVGFVLSGMSLFVLLAGQCLVLRQRGGALQAPRPTTPH